MLRIVLLRLVALVLLASAGAASAAINVFATVPEWAALAREIGGDQVNVFAATSALQDPHRIEARPSLIARARSAGLVVATGAELEIGWLPVVLRESGNAAVQPGQPGYFEAATAVRMLEVPTRLDRADGDVHPAGNPHLQLDPRNILRVAEALAALSEARAALAVGRFAEALALAGEVRAATKFPVFHAARISDVATARHAIATGKLDMVGLTRPHIADPHIVAKMMRGEEDRIRPCVGATPGTRGGAQARCKVRRQSGQATGAGRGQEGGAPLSSPPTLRMPLP